MKHKGRIIEFDGRIDYRAKHGNNSTRFDYLVSADDYAPDHQIGPYFKFEDVNYYDVVGNQSKKATKKQAATKIWSAKIINSLYWF